MESPTSEVSQAAVGVDHAPVETRRAPPGSAYSGEIPPGVDLVVFGDRTAPPDRSLTEAVLLLAVTVDVFLLLALIPALDENVNPLFQTFFALAGGLALGRDWVVRQLRVLAYQRGAIASAVLAVPLLAVAHFLRLVPLVAITTVPGNAMVRVDGERDPLVGRRLTVGAHELAVEPVRGWDSLARKYEVSLLDTIAVLAGRQQIAIPLLCSVYVSLDAEDGGAVVKVQAAAPFDAVFISELPTTLKNGDVRVQRRSESALELEFENATNASVDLPVGEYTFEATRKGCSEIQKVSLQASGCLGSAPKKFGELCKTP